MTAHSKQPAQFTIGLGWWNIYFIAKVALFLQGTIDFHPLENFALLLFILLPVPIKTLNVLRHVIAVIIAAWLLHYDSFLPPLEHYGSGGSVDAV